MKNVTIKELSDMTNIAVGTIRAWTLKPIPGTVYDSKSVNYNELYKGLRKYFGDEEFETKFGCKIEDIKIEKREREQNKYIDPEELIGAENILVCLHNYSLKTKATYVESTVLYNSARVFIFTTMKGYKCYSMKELQEGNIKIEVIE